MMKQFIEAASMLEVWVIIALMLTFLDMKELNVFVQQRIIATKTSYAIALQLDFNNAGVSLCFT